MSNVETGDSVLVEFIVSAAATLPASGWKTLGMMRGKSVKVSREAVDATADSSDATEEIALKYVTLEISGDGVAHGDDAFNQEELEELVSAEGQPSAWFRVTYPTPTGKTTGKSYAAPCLVKEWTNDSPHKDVSTWSMTASNNGAVTFTPSAA